MTNPDIQTELQRVSTLLDAELAQSYPITKWIAQWIIDHNRKKQAEVVCAAITGASDEILQKL